jgi:hypothetical protein
VGLALDTSVADYIRKLNASLNLPASLGVLLIGVLATPMIVNMAPISDRIIGASRLGGFNALQFFNDILFPLKHVAGGGDGKPEDRRAPISRRTLSGSPEPSG